MESDIRETAPQPISRETAKAHGKSRFFPGLRCANGHLSERYVSNGMCVVCQRNYADARKAERAAQEQPQQQEEPMPASSTWQYVDRGRYALEYQGHVLQALTNPDREDKRRYMAVVDRAPLGSTHTLNEAKTKAIRHVQNQMRKAKAERVFQPQPLPAAYPTDAPQPDAAQDDAVQQPVPDPEPVEQPAPEPVEVLEPEPQPEPAPMTQPATITQLMPAAADQPADAVTATFTVQVRGNDVVKALSALQAAAEMLRELGHTDCEITLPRVMRL